MGRTSLRPPQPRRGRQRSSSSWRRLGPHLPHLSASAAADVTVLPHSTSRMSPGRPRTAVPWARPARHDSPAGAGTDRRRRGFARSARRQLRLQPRGDLLPSFGTRGEAPILLATSRVRGEAIRESLNVGAPIEVTPQASGQRHSIDQAALHPLAERRQAHRAELGGDRLRNKDAVMRRNRLISVGGVLCGHRAASMVSAPSLLLRRPTLLHAIRREYSASLGPLVLRFPRNVLSAQVSYDQRKSEARMRCRAEES